MKRPAAMIKQEKPTPKKKAREQEPAKAELGTEPGEAEPGEADSQQVADQEPAKAVAPSLKRLCQQWPQKKPKLRQRPWQLLAKPNGMMCITQ